MDGFTRNDLTVVIAATNRPDVLDSALMRPGRFDRRVVVDRPESGARLSILEVHVKGKPSERRQPERDRQEHARLRRRRSRHLVNEAALSATRRGANEIEASDFAAAQDKIVLGDPRETRLDHGEKRRVAITRAGTLRSPILRPTRSRSGVFRSSRAAWPSARRSKPPARTNTSPASRSSNRGCAS